MEKNEINNNEIKSRIAKSAYDFLLSNNMISSSMAEKFQIVYGYLFTKDDGLLEALFKIIPNEHDAFYFALQNNKLSLLKMDETMYQDTISTMKSLHPCLNENSLNETVDQKERREKNNDFLKRLNISTMDLLKCNYREDDAKLKDVNAIIKRAIACLIVVQIACDINNGNYEESKSFFLPILKKYDVDDCLNEKEKRIVDGTYSRQDAIDMDWANEAYWALCWCLGLVDDIKDGSQLCDCGMAIDFVMKSNSFEDFKQKCHLRDIKEILDLEDLYFRMQWAIDEAKVNKNASIGNLNSSNVIERRRALEWVLSDVEDWYHIALNT